MNSKQLASSNQHKPVVVVLTGIILTNFYQMIDLCSAVLLSCMNLNVAFPPENPVKCKNSTMYCCKTDFCNSDAIIQEKLSKVLHASVMGKLFCALAGVSCIYLMMQILSLFDVLLESYNCIAISYKFCVEMPIL